MQDYILLKTRQKLLQLGWEVLNIYCFHQTLYLWICIYFDLYKILLVEKKSSVSWKTIKGNCNGSLFKKT